MTLLTIPLNSITTQIIDAFLNEKQEESIRLDYKDQFPQPSHDIAKLISAFANTHGGTIVLGVDAEKTNNTPLRPARGLSDSEAKGFRRRLLPSASVTYIQ